MDNILNVSIQRSTAFWGFVIGDDKSIRISPEFYLLTFGLFALSFIVPIGLSFGGPAFCILYRLNQLFSNLRIILNNIFLYIRIKICMELIRKDTSANRSNETLENLITWLI